MTNEGQPEKREVADQIQHLMTDEFVGETKAGFIQNPVLRKDDGILEIPAAT